MMGTIMAIVDFIKENIIGFSSFKKRRKQEKSAILSVAYINNKLIISNKGKANAEDIEVYIDGKEIIESRTFGAHAQDIDFSILTPSNSIGIASAIDLGTKRNFKVKVIWKDKNSSENVINEVINL